MKSSIVHRPSSIHRSPVEWLRAIADFLYPPVCPLCYAPLDREDRVICFRCEREIKPEPQWRCTRCGAGGFGDEPRPGARCRLCPCDGMKWQGALAVAPYRGPAIRCVYRFKYHRRIEIGETMGRMMCERLAEPLMQLGARLDLVVPVPLHWRRRLWRGFNQSALLALRLGESLGMRVEPRLLRRVRYTRQQARQPREKRAANVAGAFAVRRGADVRDRGTLLVDDVLTTGHTIHECARVLREAGAREVWAACFTRARMGAPDEEEWL